MQRPQDDKPLPKGKWVCVDPEWLKHYPCLCQGMCDPFWDDGKPRELWSVTLRFEVTSVHLCVNDKGLNRGLYTSGESVADALALLESALAEGVAQWRRWRK